MTAGTVETQKSGRASGFTLLIWGVALNTLALAGWTIGGAAAPASPTQTVSFVAATLCQAAAIACLGAATVVGILGLTRRARPVVWPLLSALAFPIALVILMPMVALVWALFA